MKNENDHGTKRKRLEIKRWKVAEQLRVANDIMTGITTTIVIGNVKAKKMDRMTSDERMTGIGKANARAKLEEM